MGLSEQDTSVGLSEQDRSVGLSEQDTKHRIQERDRTVFQPDLYARETVVVDVILLQDSAPVVIEIDAHLLPTVDAIVPQHRLATCMEEGGERNSQNGCPRQSMDTTTVGIAGENSLC